MRIGILTGGGDAPGLNAVIRGFVLRAIQRGHEPVGVRHGWRGLLERDAVPLDATAVSGIQRQGGTILKTSRTNPVKDATTRELAIAGYKALGLDGLVAVGGDDTLGACAKLSGKDLNALGVPKTIDNDLKGTDVTFGYDTAVNIATEALDRIHTTAASHERCIVVEIMGRHAGWITWGAGIAGGAHVTLLPEEPFRLEDIVKVVKARDAAGAMYTVVAVAEGATPADEEAFVTQGDQRDEFGHVRLGGIGQRLAEAIEHAANKETRHVVLGHLQRGGVPSAADRILGTRFGVMAAEAAHGREWGRMLAVRGTRIEAVPLSEAAEGFRTVPSGDVQLSNSLWGN